MAQVLIDARYGAGKIYKVFNKLDKTKFIVGSTILDLQERFRHYKSVCNNPENLSYTRPIAKYMREIGDDNFDIKLIEEYPCNNHLELHAREQKFIDEMKAPFNKNKAYLTDEERKDYHKKAFDKYMNDPVKARKQEKRVKEWRSKEYTCEVCQKIMSRASKYNHVKTMQHRANLLKAQVLL